MRLEINLKLTEHTLPGCNDIYDEKSYVIETPGTVMDHEDENKLVEGVATVVDFADVVGRMCKNLATTLDSILDAHEKLKMQKAKDALNPKNPEGANTDGAESEGQP